VERWVKLADAVAKTTPEMLEESSASKFGRRQDTHRLRQIAGYELRGLRKVLEDKDKLGVWGKLRRRMTPEGNWLWLCDEHWKTYTV
jgi:hypothetical protein